MREIIIPDPLFPDRSVVARQSCAHTSLRKSTTRGEARRGEERERGGGGSTNHCAFALDGEPAAAHERDVRVLCRDEARRDLPPRRA